MKVRFVTHTVLDGVRYRPDTEAIIDAKDFNPRYMHILDEMKPQPVKKAKKRGTKQLSKSSSVSHK